MINHNLTNQCFCSSTSNANEASKVNPKSGPVSQKKKSEDNNNKTGKSQTVEPPKFKLVHKPRRNPTLLENLLSSEISQERSEILQCVRYVCQQNFFPVETYILKVYLYNRAVVAAFVRAALTALIWTFFRNSVDRWFESRQ